MTNPAFKTDLELEKTFFYVPYYMHLNGTANRAEFETLEAMNRMVQQVFDKVNSGIAQPWHIERSIINIQDSLIVFERHLQEMRSNPNMPHTGIMEPDGSNPTIEMVYLGLPRPSKDNNFNRNSTFTVKGYEELIEDLRDAIPKLQNAEGQMEAYERRKMCFTVSAVVAVATFCSAFVMGLIKYRII